MAARYMGVNAYRPSFVELAVHGKQQFSGDPGLPELDLAGVPTVSNQLATAINDNRRITRRQVQYMRQRIGQACAEIRRRRQVQSEQVLARQRAIYG